VTEHLESSRSAQGTIMSSNLEFYHRRHDEEQALAAQSMDSRVSAIHLEMVSLYAKLIELETAEPPLRKTG